MAKRKSDKKPAERDGKKSGFDSARRRDKVNEQECKRKLRRRKKPVYPKEHRCGRCGVVVAVGELDSLNPVGSASLAPPAVGQAPRVRCSCGNANVFLEGKL